MKKITYFVLLSGVLFLSSCWQNTQQDKNTTKQEVETTKEDNLLTNSWQNEKIENTKTENVNKEEQEKLKKQEIQVYKKEYSEKLQNLEKMWNDEFEKLQILANANCEWVCNLDMKDQLTQLELKVAQACYKSCVKKQEQAKKKLEQLQKQLEQEKAQYPKKCFKDAEENYKKQQEMLKNNKNLPKWYKPPKKEEIIQADANRCILMYGYLNYDCEKIKDYKQPYEQCKRLRQLEQDLQFIENWKYKSFDDYLREKRMF